MLSRASREMGYGWGFGVHEALDQTGALFGPLLVSAMLSKPNGYPVAFGILLAPAIITLALLVIARLAYPRPQELTAETVADANGKALPRIFWIYLAGAGFVAAGFADFSLIAFHFAKTAEVPRTWVPIFYSVAMAVSGGGSLLFGYLLDRLGIGVLVGLTIVSLFSTPLAFLGNFWVALIGVAIWGFGMGAHESLIPAVVAHMVAPERLGSAYGIFTAAYGVCWFAGSALIGLLYDLSLPALIAFSVAAQLAAVPAFLKVRDQVDAVQTIVDKHRE